mmetsp:Transcript_18215/g.54965  ORF Transcript_18215/g.54965 Transcript_18215/m.54965 type:complete len:317 (-) Transcript_18215:214-1164(-)
MRNVGEGAAVHECGRPLESLHRRRHERIHQQHRQRSRNTKIIRSQGVATLVEAGDHPTKTHPEVDEVGGECEDGHDLGGDRNLEARRTRELLSRLLVNLGRREANVDRSEVAVIGVRHALPRDGARVDVKADEGLLLLIRQVLGRGALWDADSSEPPLHPPREGAVAALARRAELVPQHGIARCRFVEEACVDGGSKEVVRRSDCVDVARHVQVEFLHRHNLCVAPTGCATLDPKSGPHRRLPDARDHLLAQVRADCLREADGGGRLALSERRGVDTDDDDVAAVGLMSRTLVVRERELPLVRPIRQDLGGPHIEL